MRASEQNRRELTDDDSLPLEKKDSMALWLSGMLTIALPCLLLILLIVGVTMLIFGGI